MIVCEQGIRSDGYYCRGERGGILPDSAEGGQSYRLLSTL